MAIDINNWISLTQATKQIATRPRFLLENVFTNKRSLATETLAWTVYKSPVQKAKFKSKYGNPSPVGSDVRETKAVTLPRIFESKVLNIGELARLSEGVNVAPVNADAVISTTDRYILEELTSLKERVETTMEWMCAQAISTGVVICDGDDTSQTYDYEFVNGVHKVNPTADWSTSNAKIKKDLQTWKKNIYKLTGVTPTMLILGASAAQAFISSSEVMTALDTINYKVGVVTLNESAKLGAIYLGTFLGLDVFEYSWGVGSVDAFDPKTAVMLATSRDFAFYFGAIPRLEGNQTNIYIGEMLVQTLPSRYGTEVELVVESKPLPVIHNPNLLITSQVIS